MYMVSLFPDEQPDVHFEAETILMKTPPPNSMLPVFPITSTPFIITLLLLTVLMPVRYHFQCYSLYILLHQA